jgi:TolB-like protein
LVTKHWIRQYKEAAGRIEEQIKSGTKIAILNFNSSSDQFSIYVIDELTANFLDTRKLTIIDRKEIDLIRGELNFQLSGEVSDDSMQQLGKILGAQTIVSGSLMEIGDSYRIVIRALAVQTATVEVQYRTDIANDNRVRALLASGKSPNNRNVNNNVRPATSQTTVEQTPKQVSVKDLVGIWKGSYVAGQGETALILTVYEERGAVIATFDFFNLPGKRNFAEGKYYMEVTYNQGREKFYLKGTQWIERPSGYGFADLEGTITGNIFSGFTGSNNRFSVTRQ